MIQKLRNKLKDQRGFTLVELLAVIVILGIIAAIAVPAIGNIIEDSRKDAAINDALQIINAAKLAQAAGDDAEWKPGELDEFLEGATGFDSVNFKDPGFSITGHDGLEETGVIDADAEITENNLRQELASE